jgi:hypothetical protein
MMSSLRIAAGAVVLLGGVTGCDWDKDATNREWDFAAAGVQTVVVRSSTAKSAKVRRDQDAPVIKITARTALFGTSYHHSEPTDALTPSKRWPFDFVAERQGAVLRLVSKGETRLEPHRYLLRNLEVSVPPEVEVVLENAEPERR